MTEWLAEADLPDAMSISIRREVLRNGRSRVFINDAQATVSQLRELGNQLVSIHRQDDLGEVLERPALAHVLDLAGRHHDVKAAYETAYTAWREAHGALQSLEALLRAPSGDVHYLRHQIEELQGLRCTKWSGTPWSLSCTVCSMRRTFMLDWHTRPTHATLTRKESSRHSKTRGER